MPMEMAGCAQRSTPLRRFAKRCPRADIRPAIAHNEIVAPEDLKRYKALNAIPVLSFQWEKPAGDTLGLKDYFGPERMKILEPAVCWHAAGARIAFGSDWPVDALDEWFAFKVGVTRTNVPDAPPEYRGRLGDDPGLSANTVLRAATINAAYELHQDDVTGSLEVGKLADLIVLDRNPLAVPAEEIAKLKCSRLWSVELSSTRCSEWGAGKSYWTVATSCAKPLLERPGACRLGRLGARLWRKADHGTSWQP